MAATNNIGEVSTLPATPPMATRGSSATTTGLTLMMIAVGAGVSSGGSLVLLLSFAGVLAGAGLIFVGIRVADDPTAPISPPWLLVAGVCVRALIHCLHRNLALAGLLLTSVAATVIADTETGPVVRFCAFALLMLAISLISLLNIGLLLWGQEH